MEQTNHDNETSWTNESLKKEIVRLKQYIVTRDKRWAHEDTKRDPYRDWQYQHASAEERERLQVNWTRSDNARVKYRVDTRKTTEERLTYIESLLPQQPGPNCTCAKDSAENVLKRKKEDERLAKSRHKEDALKEKKRKAQDDRIAKKRLEQDARDTDERNKKDDEITARRLREDKERHDLHKEHVQGTEC